MPNEVFDLSTLANTPSQPPEVNLTPDEEAALAKMAEENPPEDAPPAQQEVDTAFIVVTKNGSTQVMLVEHAGQLVLRRNPTNDDVYGMSMIVTKDVLLQEGALHTAQTTVQMQMQQAAQMQQAMEAEAVRQKLQQSGMMRNG